MGNSAQAYDSIGAIWIVRILTEEEATGLVGYPEDGVYVAMAEHSGDNPRLLGGEYCEGGLSGTALKAAALPRYYPETAQLVVAIVKNGRLMTLWDYKTGDARDLSPATRAMFERIDDLEDETRKLKANQDYYRQCLLDLPKQYPDCQGSVHDVFLSIPYPEAGK